MVVLVEGERSVKDDKDVLFTTDGFGAGPSYQIMRDGTKRLIFDPTKLDLGEAKPDQARDEHSRSRPEF
jgi:hypothetical protein